ncbi:hypothetical protein KJZ61_02270 [Candidatus Dependentiae bacterium]|nr:hypothetical protein [Candidatus Dependentiae bacterium]
MKRYLYCSFLAPLIATLHIFCIQSPQFYNKTDQDLLIRITKNGISQHEQFVRDDIQQKPSPDGWLFLHKGGAVRFVKQEHSIQPPFRLKIKRVQPLPFKELVKDPRRHSQVFEFTPGSYKEIAINIGYEQGRFTAKPQHFKRGNITKSHIKEIFSTPLSQNIVLQNRFMKIIQENQLDFSSLEALFGIEEGASPEELFYGFSNMKHKKFLNNNDLADFLGEIRKQINY